MHATLLDRRGLSWCSYVGFFLGTGTVPGPVPDPVAME